MINLPKTDKFFKASLERFYALNNQQILLNSTFLFLFSLWFPLKGASFAFKDQVKVQVVALEKNIKIVSKIYSDTLLNIRDIIEDERKQNKEPNLKRLFRGRLPEGIGDIFILDEELNIINTLNSDENRYRGTNLAKRSYLYRLKLNPFKVHIDQPIFGAVSNAWAVPISVAIKDENNKFDGAIILSIKLESFSNILNDNRLNTSLKDISYTMQSVDRAQNIYDISLLYAAPKLFFLRNILPSSQNDINISFPSLTLNNQLSLIYDIQQLRKDFLQVTLIHFLVFYLLALALIGLRYVLRKQIIIPIRILTNEIASLLPHETISEKLVYQDNIKIIESLDDYVKNIIIQFNEFTRLNRCLNHQLKANTEILKNIVISLKESQKISHEFLEDLCSSLNKINSSKITSAINELENTTESLIKFSLNKITSTPLLPEMIDIYEIVNNVFGPKAVVDRSDYSNKEQLSLYKESLIEALRVINSILQETFKAKVYIQIMNKNNELSLEFLNIPTEALSYLDTTIHLRELRLLLYMNKGSISLGHPKDGFQVLSINFSSVY
ncbi:MAG: Cache domain [Rickettsiaceae bacterium]|jgi:hypothetical protein|nr:Cache domain [Rickettsiaceae bacterium]